MRTLTLAVSIALSIPRPGLAATYTIRPDGTGDYPTIQDALDVAIDGDVVELTDGLFEGDGNRDLDPRGVAVTIRSVSGHASACVIYPANAGRGFLFDDGEGPGTRVERVTIFDGFASRIGGGVLCDGASPTFVGVRIESCLASAPSKSTAGVGGAIACINGSGLDFSDGEIVDNIAQATWSADGGGIYADASSSVRLVDVVLRDNRTNTSDVFGGTGGAFLLGPAELERVVVENNYARGLYLGGPASVASCVIRGNPGGEGSASAVATGSDEVTFVDCLVSDNSGLGSATVSVGGVAHFVACTIASNGDTYVWRGGGGLFVRDGGDVTLHRTIVWGNCAPGYADDVHVEPEGALSATCSVLDPDRIVALGTLELASDVFAADPLFCGPSACDVREPYGDFSLAGDSPCRAEASPCGERIGALPVECGSSTATRRTSWSGLRDGFR